ncbi:hypothetical protein EIP75_23525 [Aquabacterium soli]|uniref:Uncharacterized protein n=1 Tax=Aquabacterium soli TaxID=2493092 RepID=A0A426UZD9_9BURK|nr:hypothetical protein [Aquabacterium soli]RRR99928.1 hypothetical protein EIP75_23525 [Aquabacterium soli]
MTLRSDLIRLLNQSHKETWSTFSKVRTDASLYGLKKATTDKWKTPGEPAFVSNLLEHPIADRHLRHIIDRHLGPLGLSNGAPLVSGIFIHQKPKIKMYRRPGHIELGDLLMVRHHFQTGVATPQGRAFLVQAKSSSKPGTGSLTGKEAQQFDLYSDWTTPFTFPHKEIGPPPDKSSRWILSKGPGAVTQTGFYGIVSNESTPAGFPEACAWAAALASPAPPLSTPSVTASMSLAELYEGFLLGTLGRPWDIAPANTDHWSSFVAACLGASAGWKHYPVKRLGHTGATALPRRRDLLAFLSFMSLSEVDYNFAYASLVNLDLAELARFIKPQAREWLESLKHSESDGDEPPSDIEYQEPWRTPQGPSIIYVATFGNAPLDDAPSGEAPETPDTPAAESPRQHPDWGQWG